MWAYDLRSSKDFALIVVSIATFTDVFVYGLLVPVTPFALEERIGVPKSDIQFWNSMLLGVLGGSMIAAALVFGAVSDALGRARRWPFICGLVLLGAATILFMLVKSLAAMIIARAFQGFATAVCFTLGYAIVSDHFTQAGELGWALGFTTTSLSLGWFLGPIVGGIIYEHAGYYAVFAPAVLLVLIEIVLRLLLIDPIRTPSIASETFDETAAVFNNVAETTPLLGKAPHPSVQRNAMVVLMQSPRFLMSMFGFCTMNSLMVGFDGVLPVYLKELFAFNSMQVSLTFIALTVPSLLSPFFGNLSDRFGTKWPAVAGLVMGVPGLLLMRLVTENTQKDYIILITLLVWIGLSFAVALPAFSAEVALVVESIEERNPGIFGPDGAAAQAYGLTNAGLGIGFAIGPIGAGWVRVQYGWPVMVTALAILLAVAVPIVLPVTGGPLFAKREEDLEVEGAEQGL
ncbi:MFS general substrate transporter [Trichodelitschia bisporula]|uniref:MFS general substrate transporter n=1 Tax=Trichodelitschia bisporula TaxID=703511 RepID=A0A6G1HSR6_9PEZI|nr:MFS general substrate transporter [Trichodelitschia bisporula]